MTCFNVFSRNKYNRRLFTILCSIPHMLYLTVKKYFNKIKFYILIVYKLKSPPVEPRFDLDNWTL